MRLARLAERRGARGQPGSLPEGRMLHPNCVTHSSGLNPFVFQPNACPLHSEHPGCSEPAGLSNVLRGTNLSQPRVWPGREEGGCCLKGPWGSRKGGPSCPPPWASRCGSIKKPGAVSRCWKVTPKPFVLGSGVTGTPQVRTEHPGAAEEQILECHAR